MGKIPNDPKEIFPEIIADYAGIFGDDLVSIILYGSGAGPSYRPGKSDINFMIVLTEGGIERLDLAFEMVKKWGKRNVATPLFLTEGYIETSLDVFPMEYLTFQKNYVLAHGRDVLKDLAFDLELVRLQCEREIKGKLLLLREAYLETAGKGKPLKELVANSIPAVTAICEALLYIKGKEIPRERKEIIRVTTETFNLDRAVFEELFELKGKDTRPGDKEILALFKDYLREMRKLSGLVNSVGGQDE